MAELTLKKINKAQAQAEYDRRNGSDKSVGREASVANGSIYYTKAGLLEVINTPAKRKAVRKAKRTVVTDATPKGKRIDVATTGTSTLSKLAAAQRRAKRQFETDIRKGGLTLAKRNYGKRMRSATAKFGA